jgi:hypothetical protein
LQYWHTGRSCSIVFFIPTKAGDPPATRPGYYRFPAIHGDTVIFTAEYEGPTEVHTMPVDGGLPQRRTWDASATIAGWAPDGQTLLFILVDDLPHATFNGSDAQLNAALKLLQDEISKDPRKVPEHPPYPNKAFKSQR